MKYEDFKAKYSVRYDVSLEKLYKYGFVDSYMFFDFQNIVLSKEIKRFKTKIQIIVDKNRDVTIYGFKLTKHKNIYGCRIWQFYEPKNEEKYIKKFKHLLAKLTHQHQDKGE